MKMKNVFVLVCWVALALTSFSISCDDSDDENGSDDEKQSATGDKNSDSDTDTDTDTDSDTDSDADSDADSDTDTDTDTDTDSDGEPDSDGDTSAAPDDTGKDNSSGTDETGTDEDTESEADTETPTGDATVPTEEPTDAEKKILEMYEDKNHTYGTAKIDPIYRELDAIPKEFLVGTWKGGDFEAGSRNPQNWYGKRVFPNLKAEAWVTNNPDGSPGRNNPTMGGGGLATIEERVWPLRQGKKSAALLYKDGTATDYFRKVRGDPNKPALGDIVIGWSQSMVTMTYFHLTRTFLTPADEKNGN